MPESVHAQSVANDERVAFSVVLTGSCLLFAASGGRFATVVEVDFDDVRLSPLGGRMESRRGLPTEEGRELVMSDTELVKFGARLLVKENGAEGSQVGEHSDSQTMNGSLSDKLGRVGELNGEWLFMGGSCIHWSVVRTGSTFSH